MRRWHEKLKDLFKARRITYAQAADACGVKTVTVGAWMVGRNEPPLDKLKILAELAGTTVAALLEDDPYYAASPDERALLAFYRRITPDQRTAALTLVRGVAEPAAEYSPQVKR